MRTEIIKLDKNNPDMDKLNYAAAVLRAGGLVAFPTETVYGLGANALDERAVEGIYRAKGRPSDNPLIAHIYVEEDLLKLTSEIPPCTAALISNFWPGPLTLVLPKSDIVPDIITAGLDTIAVRMPSHPIAAALIKIAGVPIAAPSANSSGRPSPTCAEHVIDDLSGKVDIIIDGGKVDVGIESTVLDVCSMPPVILRPGAVTYEQLQAVLGSINIDPSLFTAAQNTAPRSPGMKYRHYAPKAHIIIVDGSIDRVVDEINKLSVINAENGIKTAVLATEETKDRYVCSEIISLGSRSSPEIIASNLFHALRNFDTADINIILAEAIDGEGIGMAVMNRLNKAAGFNIIRV